MSFLVQTTGSTRSPDPLNADILELPEQLLDLLPAAVYVCDSDGRIIRFNKRAADLWGRAPRIGDSAEQFCGSYRLYRLDGGPLPHAECPMADVLRRGIPVRDQEVVIERPDRTRIIALVNIDPLMAPGEGVVGAINCFHDVTERKRAEEALRESEKQSRMLLEALPAAVYTTDPQGRITFFNQAAVDFAGRMPTLGSDEWCVTWRLYSPDGKPLTHDQCPMAIALKENRPIRDAEAIAERPDGTRVSFIPYPTPLHDSSGALVGAVNMLVDITERKRVEALASCQKHALQMLADGAPLNELLTFLTGMAEQQSDRGTLASIVPLNEEGTHFQRGFGTSLPDEFNAAVEGIAVSSFNGICCYAVSGRETVIVPDFGADPKWANFAQFVAPYGLRAGWSTPIIGADGRVLGTFANYYRQPYRPTQRDLIWVEIVARTAAIAIERRRREQAERQLAAIVETSDDAIIAKDLNGIIRSWNRGAEQMFGYAAEEVIGKHITILIPPSHRDEEDAIIGRIQSGQHIDHYETVRRRKGGSLIEVSLSVSPTADTDGKITGASKIARDITERKRAEAALREKEERFRALVDASAQMVWTTDANGLVVEDSPSWRAFTGQTIDQWKGSGWIDALHPQDRERIARLWKAAVMTRTSVDAEYRIRHVSGEWRWTSVRAVPLRNEEGGIRGWVGMNCDITGRKQAEEQIVMLAREAEHRSKNVLATVQATVHLTQAGTADEFKTAIAGRVQALANVHTLFAQSRWIGADLHGLITQQLSPYLHGEPPRIQIAGPDLSLEPATAQAIVICIHELATNAAKYGALASPGGRVHVSWSLADGDQLLMRWAERNGPRVKPPVHQGFGTRVMQQLIQGQLKGEMRPDWHPDGLICEIVVPIQETASAEIARKPV